MDKGLEVAVVIFIFRRPIESQMVLEAVRTARPKKLFVVADGPRHGNVDDVEKCFQARSLFDHIDWPCQVVKVYSDINLGLRERVLTGLDVVFDQVESAIILEDDCVPEISFFPFCEEGLCRFAENSKVGIISGNLFGLQRSRSNSYFFSPHSHIWGWATWKRTWIAFRNFLESEKSSNSVFGNFKNVPGFLERRSLEIMVRKSQSLDSWALDFSRFFYLSGLLSMTPKVNLVRNVGFGPNSTHTKFESWADEVKCGTIEFPLKGPRKVEPDFHRMRVESFSKAILWFLYPVLHPFEALRRILNYLLLRAKGGA